jgi:two-component sensor histidine kinase
LRVAGQPQSISALGETEVSNLVLEPNERQLQIDFYGLSLATGETLRYQYKLEGADADWSEPSTKRDANYANIAPGNYRFLVRAVSANGTVSANPAAVSFTVLRPVWQRWWFLLAAALLVGLAIYALYRYRVAQLVKLERIRTRIATDLHDDLGASLSKIAILSEIVNHQVAPVAKNQEIEKSLMEIAGTSREMVDSMADIVWVINPERDRLSDLIGRMRSLANEMTELCDISLLIDSSDVESKDLILGADLRREIYLIFKETLNNLVKHSNCERAEIEFLLEGDDFVFKVKDDGRGFDTAQNDKGATRGGNGLLNMKRRAESLGGSYRIESKVGAGTSSVLRVPLKQKFKLATFLSK